MAPWVRWVPLLLATAAACATPAPPEGLLDSDRAALEALLKRDTDAVRASDWDALTALYAPDAVRMPPNQPAITGRDAIGAFHGQFPRVESFTFTLVELDGRGDLAWYRGAYALTFATSDTTPPIADSGKLIAVLRKQPDGSWLTVADIWNSDLPAGQ